MPTIRRPSRAQVARAIAAWRIFAGRPPTPGKDKAAELGSGAAEGEAEGTGKGDRSTAAPASLSGEDTR